MRMCAIVVHGAFREGVVVDAPSWLFENLRIRASQIAVGELLGVFLAVFYFGHVLRNKSANFFIDNLGVLYAIVNGVSKDFDLGTTIHALHLRMTELRSTGWYEHVSSWSNLADGGSRTKGILDPIAISLGIRLRKAEMPELSIAFPRVEIVSWANFWKSNGCIVGNAAITDVLSVCGA
jgi:hypothetical protein